MSKTPEFQAPITYAAIDITTIEGLVFLEAMRYACDRSWRIRGYGASFSSDAGTREQQLPVAAVCHGVLVLAVAAMPMGTPSCETARSRPCPGP